MVNFGDTGVGQFMQNGGTELLTSIIGAIGNKPPVQGLPSTSTQPITPATPQIILQQPAYQPSPAPAPANNNALIFGGIGAVVILVMVMLVVMKK